MVNYSAFLIAICELQLLIFIANSQLPDYYSYNCPDTATYEQNSTFQANLRSLLSDLSSYNSSNNLFVNASAGNNAPDVIYGLFLCRGDLSLDACNRCVGLAATEIVQKCPKEKVAIIWYDQCMLRYNHRSFFGTLAISPSFSRYNGYNFSNPDGLNQVLGDVMNGLILRASGEGNVGLLKGFATGEANFSSSYKLYNLVQCTPDLSSFDCTQCLHTAFSQRVGEQGLTVGYPSCNLRYETYPFYDSTVISAAPRPPPPPPPPPPPAQVPEKGSGGKGGVSAAVIVAIVVPIIVALLLFTVAFCFLRRKGKKQQNVSIETKGSVDGKDISAAESLRYDLSDITAATNNFSVDNKIGQGGFGEVFKGTLNGEQIAVKRLSKSSGQGEQEFENEVTVVAKLQHRNLVRLLGYCLDEGEKILIYEFVPNNSLDFILFDQERRQLLDWSRRYKIIGGVAKGILYLHEDSRLRIIHRDLKASNVLLDSDMNAKISDFGMARIVGFDESQVNTIRVVGTLGYMPPEYILHGQFSIKSDVFSFGVLVLEIISGKKNSSSYESSEHLLSHAWKLWNEGKPLDLVDPTLGDSIDKNDVTRCIHTGLLCVQKDLDERPTMATVVHMISNSSMTPAMPHQPAFFLPGEMMTLSNPPEPVLWSSNGVSISEMYPR